MTRGAADEAQSAYFLCLAPASLTGQKVSCLILDSGLPRQPSSWNQAESFEHEPVQTLCLSGELPPTLGIIVQQDGPRIPDPHPVWLPTKHPLSWHSMTAQSYMYSPLELVFVPGFPVQISLTHLVKGCMKKKQPSAPRCGCLHMSLAPRMQSRKHCPGRTASCLTGRCCKV